MELSLRGEGWGFTPATMNMDPGYFQRKMEPKDTPSCLISPPICCIYPATWNFSDSPE